MSDTLALLLPSEAALSHSAFIHAVVPAPRDIPGVQLTDVVSSVGSCSTLQCNDLIVCGNELLVIGTFIGSSSPEYSLVSKLSLLKFRRV